MGISLKKSQKLPISRIVWDPVIAEMKNYNKNDNALKCKHKSN